MSSWYKELSTEAIQVQEDVHGKITPAEVRAGEPIKIKVSYNSNMELVQKNLRVWRISPLGVEVILDHFPEGLRIGDLVDTEIQIGMGVSKLNGVVVTTEHKEGNFKILGIRLCTPRNENWAGDERRSVQRWSCSKEFMPNGVAPNPGKFNDFMFFRVANISANGMLLITSLRNKFLVPGMRLDVNISLPMVGQIRMNFEIANARFKEEDGKEVLMVGGKFIKPSASALEAISQYVFQFGPTESLKDLKQSGLRTSEASRGIEFRYARTKEDYAKVLELRRLSYGEAGKLSNADDVADIFDSRSRIIMGIYRGRVIASTRLIYNEVDHSMEHEQFVTFPQDFPRKDEICEITRVCTHPDFRGSDILMGLFRFVAVTVIQSGRKYILGCATDELLPLYKKIGFNITNLTYDHKQLNNIKHTIFIGDVAKGLSGYNVNPLVWNVVWGDVAQYISDMSLIEYDQMANIRMGLMKLLRPLSLFLHARANKPKQIKNSVPHMLVGDAKKPDRSAA